MAGRMQRLLQFVVCPGHWLGGGWGLTASLPSAHPACGALDGGRLGQPQEGAPL